MLAIINMKAINFTETTLMSIVWHFKISISPICQLPSPAISRIFVRFRWNNVDWEPSHDLLTSSLCAAFISASMRSRTFRRLIFGIFVAWKFYRWLTIKFPAFIGWRFVTWSISSDCHSIAIALSRSMNDCLWSVSTWN